MLLTIGADISGTDLGYLLHKNPAREHSFDLPFGKAHVFYPALGDGSAQVALLLDIDPVGLVRGSAKGPGEGALDQYVNDRPYVASSFLSVALSRVFGTAMGGRSKERQELADTPVQWSAEAHSGFSNVDPWMKLNPYFREVNVASQSGIGGSVLEFWRPLVRLRKSAGGRGCFFIGMFEFLDPQNKRTFAFLKTDRETRGKGVDSFKLF